MRDQDKFISYRESIENFLKILFVHLGPSLVVDAEGRCLSPYFSRSGMYTFMYLDDGKLGEICCSAPCSEMADRRRWEKMLTQIRDDIVQVIGSPDGEDR